MATVGMLVAGSLAFTALATFFKPKVGVALGCLSPVLAFVTTSILYALWPSGASMEGLNVFFVPFWVTCGAVPGIVIGAGVGQLLEK